MPDNKPEASAGETPRSRIDLCADLMQTICTAGNHAVIPTSVLLKLTALTESYEAALDAKALGRPVTPLDVISARDAMLGSVCAKHGGGITVDALKVREYEDAVRDAALAAPSAPVGPITDAMAEAAMREHAAQMGESFEAMWEQMDDKSRVDLLAEWRAILACALAVSAPVGGVEEQVKAVLDRISHERRGDVLVIPDGQQSGGAARIGRDLFALIVRLAVAPPVPVGVEEEAVGAVGGEPFLCWVGTTTFRRSRPCDTPVLGTVGSSSRRVMVMDTREFARLAKLLPNERFNIGDIDAQLSRD